MSKKRQKKSGSPAKRRPEHTTGRMLIPTVSVPPEARRVLAAQDVWREARRTGAIEEEAKLAAELHAALDAYDAYAKARDANIKVATQDGVELKVGDKISFGDGTSTTIERVGDGGYVPAAATPTAPGVTLKPEALLDLNISVHRLGALARALDAEIGVVAKSYDLTVHVAGNREPRLEAPYQLEESMVTLVGLRLAALGYGDRGREVALRAQYDFVKQLNGEPPGLAWSLTQILDEAGALGELPKVLGDFAAWTTQQYPDWRKLSKERCPGCGWSLDCPQCEACNLGKSCACRGPVPEECSVRT